MIDTIRIFISYARKDAKAFAQKLYDDLKANGVQAWLDTGDMPSGDTFIAEIDRAIERSDYFLLVGTPEAIESIYCRDEWQKAIQYYKPIVPLLLRGEYADLPSEAFAYLNDARDFRDENAYGYQLEQLLEQLSIKPPEIKAMRGVPDLPNHFLPRPADLIALRDTLTAHKTTVLTPVTKKVGIYGMGGIGKSVLTAVIARDYFVRRTFKDGVFWLKIGDHPEVRGIWRSLRRWLDGGEAGFDDERAARDFFDEITANRECLIILDDVWDTAHIEAFTHLGEKCRLLLTTRNRRIIDAIGAHGQELGLLSDVEAIEFLAKAAETAIELLPQEETEIIQHCGNLPLALAMIGAMVRNRPANYWLETLEALQEAALEDIEATLPDYEYRSLYSAVKVSIDALDAVDGFDELRERYYDFAIFPNDVDIPDSVLRTFWQPIPNRKISKVLDELVNRNLLRRDTTANTLSLHNVQLTYLRAVVDDFPLRHQRLLDAYNPDHQNWWEVESDGYIYENLAYHLAALGSYDELHELLAASPDWMEAKFIHCMGDSAYVADLELAMRLYKDPLAADELVKWVQLNTARQVVNAGVSNYTDDMLKALIYMGREQEALSHGRLRPDEYKKFFGLVAIREINEQLVSIHELGITDRLWSISDLLAYPVPQAA